MMGSTVNAFSLKVLSRRWPVPKFPLVQREGEFYPRKLDHPECQTGPSGFPVECRSFWTAMQALGTEARVFCGGFLKWSG
jgi:hypothetical protein